MRGRFVVVLLVAGCLVGWNGAPALAQTHFDLAGTVTDNSGAVVPGVTVTLRNLDTGLVRASVTDERGKYNFPTVPPTGRWTLTAELSGFQTVTREVSSSRPTRCRRSTCSSVSPACRKR